MLLFVCFCVLYCTGMLTGHVRATRSPCVWSDDLNVLLTTKGSIQGAAGRKGVKLKSGDDARVKQWKAQGMALVMITGKTVTTRLCARSLQMHMAIAAARAVLSLRARTEHSSLSGLGGGGHCGGGRWPVFRKRSRLPTTGPGEAAGRLRQDAELHSSRSRTSGNRREGNRWLHSLRQLGSRCWQRYGTLVRRCSAQY